MAKIIYSKGELIGPHKVIYIKEAEPAIESGNKKVRKAVFLCPVCKNNTFICRIKDVKAGKTKQCSSCRSQTLSKKNRINLINQKYGYLTVIKYVGSSENGKSLWRCQCECGNIKDVTSSDLTSGKIKTCAQKECVYHQYELGNHRKNLIGQRFGKLVVTKWKGINPNKGGTLWLCNCDCGKENITLSSRSLLCYKVESCGCEKRSKGEKLLNQILDEMNIEYETEKIFSECKNPKTNKPLRFDFYLPDYHCCIEYDGKQHFYSGKGWNTPECLEKTQYRDKIKNEYCKDNQIKLIRIPYTDFNILTKKYIEERLNNDSVFN